MQNHIDFYDGDFIIYDTTLDDIQTSLIIIIIFLGFIAGVCLFRHLRK